MYEFWYVYVKPKYREKLKLFYMKRGGFIVYIEEDIYIDIAKDVEARLGTSNYKLGRPLPKGKNKEVFESLKDELGRKIMREFAALTVKTYSY